MPSMSSVFNNLRGQKPPQARQLGPVSYLTSMCPVFLRFIRSWRLMH